MDKISESELLAAAKAGHVHECDDGNGRQRVDADLIRRCCRELKDQIDPRGIRLRKAEITGALDLAGLDVSFSLRFDDCEFGSAPIIEGAQLYELALPDARSCQGCSRTGRGYGVTLTCRGLT